VWHLLLLALALAVVGATVLYLTRPPISSGEAERLVREQLHRGDYHCWAVDGEPSMPLDDVDFLCAPRGPHADAPPESRLALDVVDGRIADSYGWSG
jgi:hypothetical protein